VSDSKKTRLPSQIHLVNEEDHRSASVEDVHQNSNNRIEIGDYIADILVDKRSFPVVIHWIVQRRGSPEILQWGHHDDFEAASRDAVAWIESLLRYDDYRKNFHR
jgi:hypothetical protein